MNDLPLNDKVAIITGSTMGIGKAIAVELASKGANVVLNGRDLDKLKRAEADLRSMDATVLSVQADVRSLDSCHMLIQKTVEVFGKIDILINNAAITARGSIAETSPEVFHKVLDTNFIGSVLPTKAALPYIKKSKGHIIFINSIAGFVCLPFSSLYCCSKIAQSAMVDALRIELEESGIHIGIAYLNFVINDVRKKILNPNGEWSYLPERKNVYKDSPEYVAQRVVKMIRRRKTSLIVSRIGKLTYYTSRLFPDLVKLVFQKNRQKLKDKYTFTGGEKVSELNLSKI